MLKRAILALSVAFGCAAHTDNVAAQDNNDWTLRNFTYTSTGLGVKHKYRNRPVKIQILYSQSEDLPGNVAFVCANKQLMSRVSIQPGSIYGIIADNISNSYEKNTNSRRTFRPVMMIDGKKTDTTKWIEGREDRVVIPLEYSVTAELYNAVVTNQSVNLKRKKKFDMPLNLPQANEDFLAFGSECGIGKYK